MELLFKVLLLTMIQVSWSAVYYCDTSKGCDITTVINSTFVLLAKTVVDIPVEISRFNKTFGDDIFCSPLWGTSAPTCTSIDGSLCLSNCTLASNATSYTCLTSYGESLCNMAICANSSSNHLNLAQSSYCTDQCASDICTGGLEYCNTTFLTSYYNITNGTMYGNTKFPLLIPRLVPTVKCKNSSSCFCRRGSYINSAVGTAQYTVSSYTFTSDQICSSSISGNTIELNCPSSVDSVQIFVGQVLVVSEEVTFPFSYSLKNKYVDGLQISVYALSSGVVIFADFGNVVNGKICREKSCVICKDFFEQWDCQTTSAQVLSVIFLFLISVTAAIIIIYMLPPIYASVCFSCLLGKYIFTKFAQFSKFSYTKLKQSKDNLHEAMRADSDQTDEFELSPPANESKSDIKSANVEVRGRGTGMRSNSNSNLLFIAIICVIPYVNSQCSDSPTIISSFPVCTYDGTTNVCSLSFSIRSVLQTRGSVSCYNLISNLGAPLGQLKLKYVRQVSSSVAKFLYYTSSYTGFIEAHNGCYENSWCGNRCNNVDINDISGIGQMRNSNRYCVGETSCLREPSAAQCWSAQDKCYVRRWSLIPSNYSEVFNFDSISHFFELQSELTINNITTTRLFNVSFLSVLRDSYFSYQLEGAYNPSYQVPIPQIGLSHQIFTTSYGYGPYSPVNSPILGSLGELQTTTISQLSCPTDGSSVLVRKASGIFTWTGRSSGSFTTSAVSRLLPFPYISAGYSWRLTPPGTLSTEPSVVSPLAIVITTAVPINITKQVNVVCPKASAPAASGYYRSTKGYNVTFTAFSSCSSGDALVSSEHCVEVPISLSVTPGQFAISCYSDNETVTDTLIIKTTVGNFSLGYTVKLNFTTDYVNNTNNQEQSDGSVNSSSNNFLKNFRKFFLDTIFGITTGLSKLLNGFINGIIYFIFLIFAIYLFYSLFKMGYSSYGRWKSQNQSQPTREQTGEMGQKEQARQSSTSINVNENGKKRSISEMRREFTRRGSRRNRNVT